MFDLPTNWTDPSTLFGTVGLLGGFGAIVKTLVDWRKDHRQQRLDSEELVRDDLLAMVKFQGEEIIKLRTELAEARREMHESSMLHQKMIADWQDRYAVIYAKLLDMHVEGSQPHPNA